MRTSDRGLDLIKEFEGLELEAYQDIVGIWTIGYGHTSMAGPPEVVPGMEITEAEAEEILRRDLRQYEEGVERAVKVDITQNMFDALVSITYNIGVSGMRRSTFIRRINERNFEGAAEAMTWWNKAGGRVVNGLKRRRKAEADLFLEGWTGQEETAEEERGGRVEENSPRRANLGSSRTMGGAAAAGSAGAATVGAAMMGGRGDDEEALPQGAEVPAQPTEPTGDQAPPPPPAETPAEPEDGEDLNDTSSGSDEPVAGPGDPEPPVEGSAEDAAQTPPAEKPSPPGDPEGPPSDQAPAPEDELTETIAEAQDVFMTRWNEEETEDALVVTAGLIAVVAALYVVVARVDDWRNHKR